MVDDMRNVLFPIGRRDGLDLAAMNIQRGRDHGLPDYNRARDYLGFTRELQLVWLQPKRKPHTLKLLMSLAYKNFSELTDDPEIVKTLSEVYTSIDDMDLWVGGLLEKKKPGSSIGETFEKSVSNLCCS